ncbi:MAG: thiol:disulfide interchange protein DsbA/DsbL [Pseudomonadales bacterium]|nr:thiol:disulfide interchange protein DsbA/DsbL [Pseudomonadales bacterium]
MKSVLSLVLCLGLIVGQGAFAETYQYEEGTHYAVLPFPIKSRHPDKIEVTEYFSYGCPHCYEFDPLVNAWKENLPDDVVFTRTPAIWNHDYEVFAQTYYTLLAMGMLDKLHSQIFQAIHAEHKDLGSDQAMAKYLSQFGVDPEAFAKTYSSFGVRASLQQADARGKAFRSGGVPAIIVDGKYRVEGSMAGSNSNMLRVVDFLIEKERAAMQAQ